jgi:hypothetical protein
MSPALPKGRGAVMSGRVESLDGLDFFPTPPWATRALIEHVLSKWIAPPILRNQTVCDPACGEGHMVEVLREYFDVALASDIHDYGKGYAVGGFLPGIDQFKWQESIDLTITNPPFKIAIDFLEHALTVSEVGVFMLMRTAFKEGAERYRFFQKHPISIEATFAERVPMHKGRWVINGSTATSYTWFGWMKEWHAGKASILIPPGCRKALSKPTDAAKFGGIYEKKNRGPLSGARLKAACDRLAKQAGAIGAANDLYNLLANAAAAP